MESCFNLDRSRYLLLVRRLTFIWQARKQVVLFLLTQLQKPIKFSRTRADVGQHDGTFLSVPNKYQSLFYVYSIWLFCRFTRLLPPGHVSFQKSGPDEPSVKFLFRMLEIFLSRDRRTCFRDPKWRRKVNLEKVDQNIGVYGLSDDWFEKIKMKLTKLEAYEALELPSGEFLWLWQGTTW